MDNLPEDIIISIYANLHLSDIYNMTYVNNRFNNIFKKNNKFIIKNYDKYIKKNHNNYDHHISSNTIYHEDYNIIYKKYHKLNYVNFIELINCNIDNINFLEKIEINHLAIYKCFKLSLLPKFKNLYKITLNDCSSITDESINNGCLMDVRIINLSDCRRLTDISSLSKNTKLYSLNISHCYNITSDITKFNNLDILNIACCSKLIYTFDYLNNIKNVTIDCVFNKNNKHNLKNNYKVEHGGNTTYCKTWCFSCNSNIKYSGL